MSTVSGTSSVLDQYQIKQDTTQNKELGKNEFLNLLVAQLNNQNPLEPQGNGEFIAQLAQFSQVEGIEKLNTSMESLLSGYQSSQALQASSLVGRKVIIPSEKAVVDTSESFKATAVLPVSSSNVYVNVYDNAGSLVSRVNLGEQAAGNVSFIWDGKDSNGNLMPPGTYKFEAQATYGSETKGLYTMLPANVDSVTLGGGELMLNLAGLGSVPLSQVQVIGQ
ncbi:MULTISPECIES: flagellar hook assembly protein FlgD [Pseudomonas]|uniref:Basal-body rod modification protein FlgD n=2 Tax=Ectopseudomonas TaxID=3236654 RepID=A0A653AZB0_ECTOL|nr:MULTISPECIES: flagellar hook assembly protein FlgD [Pseudomonas]CAE6938329.1 Flagellar basal-body rod modification protein FlgD [Pseudomonas oleovorans]QFT22968.1 Basal-body rod modification protein FlgD [Pseudomonas sp. THAF187a]QFT43155.1 Basal-body rod modification protein FlgD [Pseudomonas sp. THAF42]WFC63209.1 flagellar hook assembly protein FlgD [Pseudomonas sp. REST10]HIQ44497.1 flagellar hook assembly protein FlgD [Pseudomonas oleovorans]|tara:strand:+ start:14308 stop:14973 length:666 start_codon:yes stop_codon:yes gene_type:complete